MQNEWRITEYRTYHVEDDGKILTGKEARRLRRQRERQARK